MNKLSLRTFSATAVAALSLTGILALSACEERPYPTSARHYDQPAPPPPPLAGAPVYMPPAQPVYAPPQQPAYNYAPPQRAYESPAIVAMAPIPNPGDAGSDGYYAGRRVYPRTAPAYIGGYAAPRRHPAYRNPAPAYAARPVYTSKPVYAPMPGTQAPAPKAYAGKLAPVGPVKPYSPPKDYKPTAPAPTYAAKAPTPVPAIGKDVKAAGAAALAAAAAASHDAAATAKTAAADAKAAYNNAKPAPAAPAPAAGPDRATRLASMQSALTDAVSKGAVLTAPDHFTANQPADVTLTLPAAFADTLRNEAQKDGLSDAAASVNMTGVLSGEGFSVTPDETQSQPLTVGQPTEFRWTVTAQPGAKGPLHADVGADLLGGGSDTLALGSVQKSAGMGVKLNARVVGASILVLIAALVVVWLARGRGPTRSATARRASRNARGARPLDMDTTGTP